MYILTVSMHVDMYVHDMYQGTKLTEYQEVHISCTHSMSCMCVNTQSVPRLNECSVNAQDA